MSATVRDDGLWRIIRTVRDPGCGSLHAMSNERHTGAGSTCPPAEGSKLLELRGHEERLRALRARRTDLEVERIVADTELRAARTGSGPEISGASAGAVVDALDRLRRLESRHAAHLAFIDTGALSHEELLQRLRAGDDALGAWLDTDRKDAGAGGLRTAKRALLVVCFAILALAFAVHLAFLVLLVPVGGAMSFLLWTGQDRAWRRMGARRRFESLPLEMPATWTEDAVRERRHALSLVTEKVRELASAPGGEDGEAEEAHLSADLDSARSDLHEALAAAGLAGDRIDESAEARVRGVARAYRAEQALQGIVEDMARERAGAGEIRESIYRELARNGEAPPDGDASAGALEAGMGKVNRR